MIQILAIEGSLPGLNEMIKAERTNKYLGAKMKKDNTELVAWACKKQKLKPFEKRIDVTINWYCKNKRKDKDNIDAGKKYIFDGLQLAGIIKNDGWNEIGKINQDFLIDKDNPRIEILMEEIKE